LSKQAEEEVSLIDKRNKTYTLDKITEKSTDLGALTVAIQPELKTETDLETNMFSPYPQSDIPFSNSTSWIGQ
jgi:plasmid replication initiation protein